MKRQWTTLLYFATALQFATLYAQNDSNLIYNPSFEKHSRCPDRIDALGVMSSVDAWWQPTAGSSDYFNSCGSHETGVPHNKMGVQTAHSGNAYCGIYCSKEDYREYLQTELKEPLLEGHRYRIGFWANRAAKSPNAIATLGALLTTDRISDSSWNILMHNESTILNDGQIQTVATYYVPQVVNPSNKVIVFVGQWYEVSGEFIAVGGEKYLTIGNFNSFNRSSVVDTKGQNTVLPGAYYYIDDVSVVCLDCTDDTHVANTIPTPSIDEIITLQNILFNTDESILLPQSYNELRMLLDILNSHPTMKIELRGHTDDKGSIEHNRILSEARAKAVADYLIYHGITPSRLLWKGYGKSMPIDTNATPEGRHNNRRVEYRIVEL